MWNLFSDHSFAKPWAFAHKAHNKPKMLNNCCTTQKTDVNQNTKYDTLLRKNISALLVVTSMFFVSKPFVSMFDCKSVFVFLHLHICSIVLPKKNKNLTFTAEFYTQALTMLLNIKALSNFFGSNMYNQCLNVWH